jgi:hypothetical protein
MISQHQRITGQGIFRALVVRRRGLIYIYLGEGNWKKFDLEALARRRQEVEFQQETRIERVREIS